MISRLYFASETNNLLVAVNVGVESNSNPYDMVYFSSPQIFQSNNIQTIFDNNISPVFLFDIGYELFLSRYFSFNSKINYAICNLDTETVSYRTFNGNIDFDPMDFGIAQRLSLQVGIAFHILNAK